jgi:hypothetical protein
VYFAIYVFHATTIRIGFSYGTNYFIAGVGKYTNKSQFQSFEDDKPKKEPEFLDRFRLDSARPKTIPKKVTSTLQYKNQLHSSIKRIIDSDLDLCETFISTQKKISAQRKHQVITKRPLANRLDIDPVKREESAERNRRQLSL